MKFLFSKKGLALLESLASMQTLYAFDFDGTLSKIVRVPSKASLSPTTEALMEKLSKIAPVAIISGRSVKDVRGRLGFRPRFVVGNHGSEGLSKNNASLKKAKKVCEKWQAILENNNFETGVELENKAFSLTLHYRRAKNMKKARDQILKTVVELKPAPQLIMGKAVVNLLPKGAPHKGTAVLELSKRMGATRVFYIGDDDTDEHVFGLPDARVLSVRVCAKKSSHAQFYIKRQSDINQLLRLLIRNHQTLLKAKD